jgi:hypothetical protein
MLTTRIATSAAILGSLGALCLPAQAAAQSSRTFVSAAVGNDGNDCSRATPCRTFQGAHDKTNPDGEVTVLDPGGYGSVNLTKSISIVNDGVGEASILVSGGGGGITINAGPASYINLRGITIQGIGFGGGIGLRFNAGFSLTMENCVVRNHTGDGIEFFPNVSSMLALSNTLVADNGGDGIKIAPVAVNLVTNAVLDRVRSFGNSGAGIYVNGQIGTGTLNVAVNDSVAANNNGGAGFDVESSAGHATVNMSVFRSVIANSHFGLFVAGTATTAKVFIAQSMMSGTVIPWDTGGGAQLLSYGDNYIQDNVNPQPAPLVPRR